ncbi:MAG: M48 family metallopeptidase, partial [Terriglobales bacterium]
MIERHHGALRLVGLAGALCLLCLAQASYYKPNWTLYSPQQDVQMGQQAEQQALQQLPMLDDPAAQNYVSQLGEKLAGHMPGPKFPFNFHLVNQKDINAFALPGGPVFVNVGAVCAARNEAQLAGVMAHEESHIALRHSTSMASKKEAASLPLSILGGIFNSGTGRLAALGAQFVAGSVFLKYSRDMESQADALGAQVMNAAGYDPRQMAQFFETLQAQGGSGSIQFLSDHPDPGNRTAAIEKEIPTLGSHPPYHDDSAGFDRIHSALCNGTTPKALATGGTGAAQRLSFQGISIALPAGWRAYGDQTSQLTLAPANGLSGSSDQTQVVRGVIVSSFQGSQGGDPRPAIDQLVAQLQQANPQLRPVAGSRTSVRAAGVSGTSVM